MQKCAHWSPCCVWHFLHGSSSTMVTSDIDEFEQCHWVLPDTIQPQAYIQHTLYMVLPVLWWRVILMSLSSIIESFETLFNPRHTFSTLYTWFFQYYGDEWYCWVWAVSLSPSRHYSTPGIHSAHFCKSLWEFLVLDPKWDVHLGFMHKVSSLLGWRFSLWENSSFLIA